MENHSTISFRENPIIWFMDKFKTVRNHPVRYSGSVILNITIVIGVIANISAIFIISSTLLTIILLVFLFFYGLINLVLVYKSQRKSIQISRIQTHFNIIHQKMIHLFRDYISERDYYQSIGAPLDESRIEEQIKNILVSFNDSFMKIVHRKDTTITLKYKKGNKLFPLRVGEFIDNRDEKPEFIKNSFIYSALNKSKNKLKFIYVKNIHKPDKYELLALGNDFKEIGKRALNYYSTFIALPIRSGDIKNVSTKTIKFKRDLGLLGFDLKRKYDFGNIYEYEIEILCTLVDLLSILTKDLISVSSKK